MNDITSSTRPATSPGDSSPPETVVSSHAASGAGGGQGIGPRVWVAKHRLEFSGYGMPFSALHECQAWLTARGFSYGDMQGAAPIGVMFGEVRIAKWRNLDAEEKADLHGQIIAPSGSFRSGPVVLVIRRDAPTAVTEAFLAEDESDPDKAAQASVEGVGA